MRNEFNLSHEHKTTVDMGELIPVMCEEVLPGDTFLHRATALARIAPLAHPLMHRVELRMHTFYVPNRVAWNAYNKQGDDPLGLGVDLDWEDFITGEDDTAVAPFADKSVSPGSLWDYMGVPRNYAGPIDNTPLIAVNMIWNHYYRDQQLQNERGLTEGGTMRCAWQKDYFTICRPSPQQGEPIDIPVGVGTANVAFQPGSPTSPLWKAIDGSNPFTAPASLDHTGTGITRSTNTADENLAYDPAGSLAADFTGSNAAIAIDDLRRSIALQRFAEARMRYGSRYVDYLRYLGVNPSDGRLDRPEYLGGGKEILNFSEVLSTADTTETNVGDMYGHGIGLGRQNGYRKMFEEHGWVITLLSARPKTVYSQALPRKFMRDAFDSYWQKELELLPWQEVKEQEVYAAGSAETVFGYTPRYEEYRHGCSHVSASMRGGNEQDWHMSRDFDQAPVLNGSFIECTPTDRIYQDTNMPDLILNVMHDIRARRLVGATASMGVDL